MNETFFEILSLLFLLFLPYESEPELFLQALPQGLLSSRYISLSARDRKRRFRSLAETWRKKGRKREDLSFTAATVGVHFTLAL